MQELTSQTNLKEIESWQHPSGFTIVELLMVVVVIATLAAVTIVAYNGITTNAKESALKSDLSTAAKKLNVEKAEPGIFPSAKPGFIGGSLSYSGGGNAFCVTGSANGKDFRITEVGTVEVGDCAPPVATTMQTFTPAYCSALATYTGSNPAVVVSLTDSRGGTTRTYEVAKLADDKCWMLTNLKLGESTPITLTPTDSDVDSNFTLPALRTSWLSSGDDRHDIPAVYGPITGDTNTGSTNYGHLYSWAAATAGETRVTSPAGSGAAPYSVCPAGWKLPTGGSGGEFAQLDVSFGGAGAYVADGPSQPAWLISGAFKGVHAGSWNGSFYGTGSIGLLWSSSAQSGNSSGAYFLGLTPSYIAPGTMSHGNGQARGSGLGTRCLLK